MPMAILFYSLTPSGRDPVSGGLTGAFYGALGAYKTSGGDVGAAAVGAVVGGVFGLVAGAPSPIPGALGGAAGDLAGQIAGNLYAGKSWNDINMGQVAGATLGGALGGELGQVLDDLNEEAAAADAAAGRGAAGAGSGDANGLGWGKDIPGAVLPALQAAYWVVSGAMIQVIQLVKDSDGSDCHLRVCAW